MLHSLRDIWIPNKITKTFLEGKREYHVHPFRFYFICLIIFFTLLSFLIKNWDFEDFELKESISKYELYHKLDTLSTHYTAQCEPGTWDSLKLQLYRGSKDLDRDTFFDLELLGTDFATFGISTLDAVNLEPDSLFSKYEVTEKKDQYLLTQMRRVVLNPETATKFAIGNMIWGFILLTIIMGGVLKLLYLRHDSYYIEHLLHIANYHCLTILLYSIAFAIQLIHPSGPLLGTLIFISFVGGVLYLIVSLKLYYRQSIFKTLIKAFVLGFAYWMAIIFIAIIISVFSLIIF